MLEMSFEFSSFVAVTSSKRQDGHIAKVSVSKAPSIQSNLVANPTYGVVAHNTDMEDTVRYMKNPLYGDRENPMYGTNHAANNGMYSGPRGAAEEEAGGIYSVPSVGESVTHLAPNTTINHLGAINVKD